MADSTPKIPESSSGEKVEHGAEASVEFFDPLGGQYRTLVLGDSALESGVRHDGCEHLALADPVYDCAYCDSCGWQARISGAWVLSHFEEAPDGR